MTQQVRHYGRHILSIKATHLQSLVGAAAQRFQALNHVSGAAQGSFGVLFHQGRWHVAVYHPARIIQQAGIVQPQCLSHSPAQAGNAAYVKSRQRGKQAHQLFLGGRLAQGVQAILDLHILDFAKIAVDFQHEFAEVVGLVFHPQVAVQFRLLDHLPDLAFQHGQLGRVQGLTLVVFVHQLFQLGNVAIAVGCGHGRDQMVNDGGVGAALGLGTLAGVIDDKRVEQGQVL